MSSPQFAVNPYRFSENPPAMVAFLEVLGLRKVLTTSGDWFGILQAGAGFVAVHAVAGTETNAEPGETQLVLLTAEAASAAEALNAKGLEVVLWDESYGQHVGVVCPAGGGVWINEHQRDLYGYLGHEAEPDARLTVVMVRASADRDADRSFFANFGFTPDPGADEWWEALRADSRSGVIGLHKPTPGELATSSSQSPFAARTATARLGFETTEDLDALAARLTEAGFAAHTVVNQATTVHVVDPDGTTIEINSSPAK